MRKSVLHPALALLALVLLVPPSISPAHAAQKSNAQVSGKGDFNLYCASCHGRDGKGHGPQASKVKKKVPDLTLLTKKYGTFPEAKLARIIDGRDPLPDHGTREMPVWGDVFKAEAARGLGGAQGDEASVKRRLDNLIAYVKTMQVH